MTATIFYAARRYGNDRLSLIDRYGAGSPEHRHEHTERHPRPFSFYSNEAAWTAANRDLRDYGRSGDWTPVVVTEDELLELERGSA
jgi:hypothetical protein